MDEGGVTGVVGLVNALGLMTVPGIVVLGRAVGWVGVVFAVVLDPLTADALPVNPGVVTLNKASHCLLTFGLHYSHCLVPTHNKQKEHTEIKERPIARTAHTTLHILRGIGGRRLTLFVIIQLIQLDTHFIGFLGDGAIIVVGVGSVQVVVVLVVDGGGELGLERVVGYGGGGWLEVQFYAGCCGQKQEECYCGWKERSGFGHGLRVYV